MKAFRDCGFYGFTKEKNLTDKNNDNNYKQIKPESDITIEEAKDYVENLFLSMMRKEKNEEI